MRTEATFEDYVPSIVLSRLKSKLGLTFEEICVEVGIPESTLCGNIGTSTKASVISFPGRILKLADYFKNKHGLDYVNTDYLLRGGDEDAEKIKILKRQIEIEEQIKNGEETGDSPPFLLLTGQ